MKEVFSIIFVINAKNNDSIETEPINPKTPINIEEILPLYFLIQINDKIKGKSISNPDANISAGLLTVISLIKL